ncbi:phosphatase [Photobacterium proteolyticum]|uniref:Phosphatase n=1 Tax=Photobacterium proteolyticum TaxID=1903952 RepID=A0A1Q9GFK2_9GAMM|nr:phosphatase [Photobacterium proteolyticum]OLQ73203.1 phosphatase [Photobacterium proteolyticum]
MQFSVDTHTHTISSGHAYSTLLENAEAAASKGLSLFCVTDHAPSMPGAPHFWHFANQRVLPRFLHGVGILRGIEANVLNQDGEIDIDPRISSQLDWVIGSLHEPVYSPSSRQSHTDTLLNVIRSGRIHALGHLGNPNFDFDFEAVVSAAAQYNVLIEINNSSLSGSRQGSEPRCEQIAAFAREAGARLTTGSDAHFAHDVGNFSQVDKLLARVNFPLEQVVTHHPRCFLEFLQERGQPSIEEFAEL